MTTHVERPTGVVSVPADHPYVASSIATPGRPDDGLVVYPDVVPPDRPAGQWWPPLALDPDVLRRWLDGDATGPGPVDLVHVHFGFEGVSLAAIDACTELLRRRDVPLVLTVHDLRNPHLPSDEDYAPRLDRLVGAADAVLTLTEAAAAELRRRWGVAAVVVPHPHVAPLERIVEQAPPRAPGPLRVGLALKSLRANTLTAAQVEQVAAAVTGTGADLEVSIHAEALHSGFVRHDPAMTALLHRLSADPGGTGPGRVTVRPHQRLDDDAFLDDLARHDAVILPYRFGTHSGVLEACRDMHTLAVLPDVGCYSSQAPGPTYSPDDIAGTLPAALHRVAEELREPTAGGSGWFVDRASRQEQARQVRAAHRRVYADVLDARLDRQVGA